MNRCCLQSFSAFYKEWFTSRNYFLLLLDPIFPLLAHRHRRNQRERSAVLQHQRKRPVRYHNHDDHVQWVNDRIRFGHPNAASVQLEETPSAECRWPGYSKSGIFRKRHRQKGANSNGQYWCLRGPRRVPRVSVRPSYRIRMSRNKSRQDDLYLLKLYASKSNRYLN